MKRVKREGEWRILMRKPDRLVRWRTGEGDKRASAAAAAAVWCSALPPLPTCNLAGLRRCSNGQREGRCVSYLLRYKRMVLLRPQFLSLFYCGSRSNRLQRPLKTSCVARDCDRYSKDCVAQEQFLQIVGEFLPESYPQVSSVCWRCCSHYDGDAVNCNRSSALPTEHEQAPPVSRINLRATCCLSL